MPTLRGPFLLPQELVDLILDHLVGARSFKACSLVSRAWMPRSRSYLFKTCKLSLRNLGAFCDLLRSPNCTFIPHVRSIAAYRCSGDAEDHCFNDVAEDLRRLINVRTLDVILNIVIRASNVEDYFLRGFFTAFPHITRLDLLCGGKPPSLPAPLIKTLCMFPALQVLVVRETSSLKLEEPPADAIPPPGLHSLTLGMGTGAPILAWLHATGHLPNVNSLKLDLVKLSEASTVRAALQQVGGALHHLDIDLTWTPETYWARSSTVFDLALHPNLKTLTLHDSSWDSSWIFDYGLRSFDTNQMIQFITRLSAPTLERISVALYLRVYENAHWEALDAFLCSDRFPRLRTVAF
ncbi:hypothetical protein MVEN_00234200 [Mycena venus]|uniref:F-box domain-containing protein n=1 Tax=Mycena venus TaxID=2733690 RepID=A0A8H6Z175_9AGAR|nr:hypothetical protein MVEN_00234200 [Mycena venus]